MILVDTLPSTVEIGGSVIKLNTDYRYWILFEQMLSDKSLDELEKLVNIVELCFADSLENIEDFKAVMDAVMWFYRCGLDSESEKQGKKCRKNAGAIYDYEIDGDYILSAFLTQYRIDLTQEQLHWWKFRALMRGLHSDCEFVKIMGYRSIDITNDMSKEQQKFYRDMKEIYALEDNRSQEEKEADFYAGLSALF